MIMVGLKDVDWEEPPLKRWLESITRKGTKATYKSGYRFYATYTGMTATQLVDEALADAKKDSREKTDIVRQRLIGFYNWLVNEAPKRKAMGKGKVEQTSKGVSSTMAHCYVNAVRSFYSTFDVFVKLKGRSKLPRAKVMNRRKILSHVEVRKLIDHCRTPRDRAIILCMFQSGMDVSTLCSLRYGDVMEGLARGDHPLKLELTRPKTGTEYYTFLGKDACEALHAYLNDVKAKGIRLESRDPLFLKESYKALKKQGITPNLVQKLLRDLAVKAGFVDENNNGKDFNPLSPHCLRESFGSIMISKSVPDSIVDFWLGHVDEMAEAYKRGMEEDLKRIYLEKETFLSISKGEAEAELRSEIEEKSRQLQEVINGLVTENLKLKKQMEELERKVASLEHMYNLLFELSPEELRKIIEIANRAAWQKQSEKDLEQYRKETGTTKK